MKEYASVIVRAAACADESSEKIYFGNDQKDYGTIVIKWEKSLKEVFWSINTCMAIADMELKHWVVVVNFLCCILHYLAMVSLRNLMPDQSRMWGCKEDNKIYAMI